jgi:hypothetical protein
VSISELDKKIADVGGEQQYIENMSNFGAFSTDEKMSMFDTLTGFFGDRRAAAHAMGMMQATNQYISKTELDSMTEAMGGGQNLADAKGGLSAAGLMENVSRYNTLKELFGGNAEEAYKAMGQMSGENSLIAYKDLQTMKGLYGGDVKELADAKAFMSAFNFLQQQGGIDSVKDKMSALGFTSVRQFSEFASNNFTLNEEMANRLDAKYNTSAFEEGHRITFDVNSSGGVSNMVAHRNDFAGNVDGYSVGGATETLTFGKDGLLYKSYDGVINGSQGHLFSNANGTIYSDLKQGRNSSLGDTTHIGADTLLAAVKGERPAIDKIDFFTDDIFSDYSKINQVASSFEQFMQHSISNGSSLNLSASAAKVLGITFNANGSIDYKYDQVRMGTMKEYEGIRSRNISDTEKDAAIAALLHDKYSAMEEIYGKDIVTMAAKNFMKEQTEDDRIKAESLDPVASQFPIPKNYF